MKEEYNLLQTYDIFLKMMYISLLKEFYMQMEYDSLGRKVKENDKEKNLREYSYDNLGRVIKEISPEGIELSYSYDARGNVTEYIDGRKTKFVRKYTKTDLLSSEEVFTVKEDDNNYKSTPDASRSYAYDEGGILKQVTEGSSSIFYNEKDGSYQSDAYGNIRSMKWSSTGLEMNYEYDNLNRMTSVITPDGKEVAYTYNMNNQVTSLTGYINESITYSKAKISEYTLLNGIKKSFEYNDLGVTSSLKYNKNKDEINISTGFSYTYDDNYNVKTRTSLDTKKLSSFDYDQANRLTNSYMEGEFESKTAEQLTTSNFSYINRDLVGAKQELVKYEALPEKIIFDTSARSYVYDFNGTKEIRAIELYPENKVHRVRERDIHIYVKENTEDAWVEVRNWKFNKDEKNGKLSFVFKEAVRAGYVKVRSSWDDRNKENVCIDDYSTFKGNANNLLRIWTLENTLTEEYSYDGNSNRISFVENGNLSSYEYYKNKQGGNTAKVKYDGKWYYTYDENGNRTSRAKALISGVADPSKEYWTYEWDLWNRLVKVVQYNVPDNGECVEVSYEYDALNHRISRTTDSETTKYAYGRNGALAYQEKTVDGSVTKRSFAYLNNEIVGFTDKLGEEEAAYYTVTDIQGSITEVYDGSSKLVWKSGYTAFGQLAGEVVDLIDFDGMYTGCDYDAETGLTYHWNRWRSEDGSCFITQDPIRDGLNWYVYCNGDPVNYFDNFGLSPKSALELISEKRDVINRVSEYYEVDPAGVASVIFQEKYHGIWAEAKNGLAYIAELGIHDKTDPATSFGLAEMQLQRAAALLGADIKQSGIKKEMYNELMKDDRSIALIALNIAENEKVLGFKLEGSAAGYAHNMGAKRYNDYLNQVENPPNDKIPKRSENYQEAIKDALNGIVDTRTDSERKNK